MSKLIEGHLVFGFNQDGIKFRPSDWMERIASLYGCYSQNNRLCYNKYLMPIRYEGQRCLFISDKLEHENPKAYRHVMEMVQSNQLQTRYLGKPLSPKPPAELPCAA